MSPPVLSRRSCLTLPSISKVACWSLGPCLLPRCGTIASSIQAYRTPGETSQPILVVAVVRTLIKKGWCVDEG